MENLPIAQRDLRHHVPKRWAPFDLDDSSRNDLVVVNTIDEIANLEITYPARAGGCFDGCDGVRADAKFATARTRAVHGIQAPWRI